MTTKFSIGDISRMHNISIQALRHYDKIGLLKPSYINKGTGYRYYTAKDFITIDLIKQCKAMGLSLDEIKEIIQDYTSLDSILNIIGKQKDIIDRKINELNNIKNNITFLEKRIGNSLKDGLGKVIIKDEEERVFIWFDGTNRFTEEFEIKLSKTLAKFEQKYDCFNKELAFEVSYSDIKEGKTPTYNNMMMRFTKGISYEGNKTIILPKGRYISINFDDTFNDTTKYYNKLLDYIIENKIEPKSDFYEIYIITRVSQSGEERSLGSIQILI